MSDMTTGGRASDVRRMTFDDNALVALGLARYGLKAEAARVFEGQHGASLYQEGRRLPELFCGFIQRKQRGPTNYPVACSPQAWAEIGRAHV